MGTMGGMTQQQQQQMQLQQARLQQQQLMQHQQQQRYVSDFINSMICNFTRFLQIHFKEIV